MAGDSNFSELSGNLALAVAQTFNYEGRMGKGNTSCLVICNDDAADTINATVCGSTVDILPGEVREFYGVAEFSQVVLSNANAAAVATPFRINASTGPNASGIQKPLGQNVTSSYVDGSITEVKIQAAGTENVLGLERTFVAVFDPSANAAQRTVATHLFGPDLPDNAIIIYAWWEVVTNFTSGGAAELALGVETVDVAGIKAATVVTDAAYQVGVAPGTPNYTPGANFTVKTTSAGLQLNAAVTVAALTAGKLIVHGVYVVGA